MTFVTGLIIGLIVGWVIEWLIDWFFWRRDDKKLRQQLTACQERVKALEAELAAIPQSISPSKPIKKDPLEKINGVGPKFAKRLNQGGIYTFDDLANQKPNHIRELIAPEEWQKIEPEDWVAKARKIVGLPVDPLADVNGIGPAFAKRLNAGGIYTFADLAALTPAGIHALITPEEWQKIEPEAWIAEAAQLAQELAKKEKGGEA